MNLGRFVVKKYNIFSKIQNYMNIMQYGYTIFLDPTTKSKGSLKGKGKAEHLYSALHGIQTTLKRSGMDHIVLPATNTMPALPRKRSPDGASTD